MPPRRPVHKFLAVRVPVSWPCLFLLANLVMYVGFLGVQCDGRTSPGAKSV